MLFFFFFFCAGYSRVILVGGGIGITPCHSIFATHLNSILKDSDVKKSGAKMDLVWIVRHQQSLQMFDYTWQKYERAKLISDRFSVDLYVTRSSLNVNKNLRLVRGTKTLGWQNRRPLIQQDLAKYFNDYDDNKNILMFVCGPLSLVQSCERLAISRGAHFMAESFEF